MSTSDVFDLLLREAGVTLYVVIKACACRGIGAVTESLGEDNLAECDWGHCSRESVATRMDDDEGGWLAVCAWHAGWEDYPS